MEQENFESKINQFSQGGNYFIITDNEQLKIIDTKTEKQYNYQFQGQILNVQFAGKKVIVLVNNQIYSLELNDQDIDNLQEKVILQQESILNFEIVDNQCIFVIFSLQKGVLFDILNQKALKEVDLDIQEDYNNLVKTYNQNKYIRTDKNQIQIIDYDNKVQQQFQNLENEITQVNLTKNLQYIVTQDTQNCLTVYDVSKEGIQQQIQFKQQIELYELIQMTKLKFLLIVKTINKLIIKKFTFIKIIEQIEISIESYYQNLQIVQFNRPKKQQKGFAIAYKTYQKWEFHEFILVSNDLDFQKVQEKIQEINLQPQCKVIQPQLDIEDESIQEDLIQKLKTQQKSTSKVSNYQSLSILLNQGIQNNDTDTMNFCLNHSDQELIENTTQKIDSGKVIQLIEYINKRLSHAPYESDSLLIWLKLIIQYHSSIIITAPNFSQKLTGMQNYIEQRSKNLSQLNLIKTKLSIIKKIDNKQSQDFSSNLKPMKIIQNSEQDAEQLSQILYKTNINEKIQNVKNTLIQDEENDIDDSLSSENSEKDFNEVHDKNVYQDLDTSFEGESSEDMIKI